MQRSPLAWIRIASRRYDASSSLRGPNTPEMLAPDQRIVARSVNSTTYGVRPWMIAPVNSLRFALIFSRCTNRRDRQGQAPKGKDKGRGKQQASSSQPLGKGSMARRVPWITELVKDNAKHSICVRYTQGFCQSEPRPTT